MASAEADGLERDLGATSPPPIHLKGGESMQDVSEKALKVGRVGQPAGSAWLTAESRWPSQ